MNWRKVWNDPVWSKVIAGVILAVGGFVWATTPDAVAARTVLVVLVVSGITLLGWLLLRPKIAWNFDSCLGMVGGSGQIFVLSFQASGVNRSRRGIQSVSGHLVSNIDNARSGSLRFVIGGQPVSPDETTGVAPNAGFQIMIPFSAEPGAEREGRLTENEFLRRWSSFRFVAEFDDFRYERTFSQRQVARVIEAFKRAANPLPKPEVRKK